MKQIKSKKRVRDFGEVYTQEREVKAMLDLVKEESYRTDSLFLEPACGNGNFLVEILKRKLTVAQNKKDVTASLSSIYAIDILEDNVIESKKRLYELVKNDLTQEEAFFIMNQNIVCGDSLELLKHSPYIDMKFDVIIGNPPYQLNDGGAGSSAMPLYHKFAQRAKELNPKYISMIIKSNWFSGGKGLDSFRNDMLNDHRISHLVDFPNSKDCFPNNKIEGGVCYFLWDTHHTGDCEVSTVIDSKKSCMVRPLLEENVDTFIRFNEGVSVLKKISAFNEGRFSEQVSARKPFGFESNFKGFTKTKQNPDDVLIYANKQTGYISLKYISKNQELLPKYKVFISEAYGLSNTFPKQILNKPILAKPNSCCTETYLVVGTFESEEMANNLISYMETKFFRFLVSLKKYTQHGTSKVYEFVPLQDFSKPWSDDELYKKYGLTQEEIDYIESMIRPMK